jgi:hypothetical protein
MLQAVYIWSLMHGLASLLIDKKLQADMNIDELIAFFDRRIQHGLAPVML